MKNTDYESPLAVQFDALAGLTNMSELMFSMSKNRRVNARAILGGAFGFSGYELCSFASVINGLDAVMYFVREADSKFILGSAFTKDDCIKQARVALQFLPAIDLKVRMAAFKAWTEKSKVPEQVDESEVMRAMRKETVKRIPKRRQKIFDACGGKCYYCGCELVITGRWHIDHKMPKALLGDNSPQNLVASCAPCNHKKRDTTDQEFLAKLGAAA